MSKIKSALELALERTAGVEMDKNAVLRDEAVNKGKNLAGRFLNAPEGIVFEKEWKGLDKREITWRREGLLDTLLANLTLPRHESDLSRFQTVSDGLKMLARKGSGKNLDYLLTQCRDLLRQYLGSLVQLEEGLRSQWGPRLRQKEEQLRKQTGQMIKLAPEQDPEFVKVLSEQLASLDAQYNEVLAKGKVEMQKLV